MSPEQVDRTEGTIIDAFMELLQEIQKEGGGGGKKEDDEFKKSFM